MEQHRKSNPCRACHQIMDPIGMALENFDAIGLWRTKDSGIGHRSVGHRCTTGTPRWSGVSVRKRSESFEAFLAETLRRNFWHTESAGLWIIATCRRFVRSSGCGKEEHTGFQHSFWAL